MVTAKVAVVAPAATVTVAGTVAAEGLLEVNTTGIPPVGAALPSVTVPVEGAPPGTDVGFSETAVTTGGSTANVADLDAPKVALITGLVNVWTG